MSAEQAAAVSLILWLVGSLAGFYLPDLIISFSAGEPLPTVLWLGIVGGLLASTGARPFLEHVIPHHHDHTHRH